LNNDSSEVELQDLDIFSLSSSSLQKSMPLSSPKLLQETETWIGLQLKITMNELEISPLARISPIPGCSQDLVGV
jgi:hypothetical protein